MDFERKLNCNDFRRVHHQAAADHRVAGLNGALPARRASAPQGKGRRAWRRAQAHDGDDRGQGQEHQPPHAADGAASRQGGRADKGT